MLSIALMPLLEVQRQLYDIPLGSERFRAYLQTLTGGTGEMVLPLALMNPMESRTLPAKSMRFCSSVQKVSQP